MEFRYAIKSFRNGLGISQAELAEALCVSEGTVRRWESGKNLPKPSVFSALMDYTQKSGISSDCIEDLKRAVEESKKIARSVAAEQLVAQQRHMISILNETPSGISVVEVDPHDVIGSLHTVYYNDRFFSFSGYDRDEYDAMIQKNEMNFVHEADIPNLISETEKICQGEIGASADTTIRYYTKDGGSRWLLMTAQLAKRRGNICTIYISLVDVTARMEAIDRQRISEEMLRIAAETDNRAMIVYDVKNNLCRVESQTLFFAKYGETFENVPQSIVDMGIVEKDSVNELRILFARIQNCEQKVKASFQICRDTGKYEWFECNATTVFDANGLPDHAVLVFHNITEQRIKEAVFKKWQQSIDTRSPESYTLFRCNLSKDAAIDEQNGELIKIKYPSNMVSFNDRAKLYADEYVYPDDRKTYTDFLDSNTLLAMFYRGEHTTTIEYREIGDSGEEKWRRLTIEMVEHLDSSDVQVFLMYEDIDDDKKVEIEARELAESDPLTGALNRVAFADKVDAIIHANPSANNALIMLDMDGFKKLNDTFGHAAGDQALQEVAAVLRSYIRKGDFVCRLGGDEFLVWLRNVTYDAVIAKTAQSMCEHIRKAYSKEVLLSASIGIAVYPRDGHSFDDLYQNADKALYNVKQAQKGSYAFRSVIGEEQTPEVIEALSEVRQTPPVVRGTKRRILIVDDNESSRMILKNIFNDEYLIETARNGAEAMIRMRHFGSSISVVLLDLMMPGVDGFSVLKKMRNNTELCTIPVIVVTGNDERTNALKAIELGAAEYVTKPVDVDLLRMRVHSVIRKEENERLRAQNSYLMLQRTQEAKYRTVLESTGTVVIEYDCRTHVFIYDNEISKYIAGNYDHRGLWHVLLADMVAESADVKAMQNMLMSLANDRGILHDSKLFKFKTPDRKKHWFRVNIYKKEDEYSLAERLIITFNDVNDEVVSSEKLLFQATRDELTGIYNRAGFIEKAEELIAAQNPGYYVMACTDIEKFSIINDQYGTAKGDEILRKFARVIENLCNAGNGICCRIMADNFAILYPAKLIDSQLLENAHHTMEYIDVTMPPIKFSVGRCIVDDKSLDVTSIYGRAAIAKSTIKGRFDTHIATFDESMRAAILRRQEITGQMKKALEKRQFEVWLQPQFNHATGKMSGAEALVRWRHPVEGIISPAEFIPIFERSGFIYEMDKFVWTQVCVLLRRWLDRGLSPMPISVNVSRYDVFRDDLVNFIENLVTEYDIPRDLLRLEITESAFSESTDQIIRVVQEFVNAGFTVEIDDFGSGYSSLNTLKDVPAQVLKMDMRFLENDSNAQRGGSIIESVVRMAKWLGMAVIAEGVETIKQADYLQSIGCNYIQGYLYAKPMTIDKFETFCNGFEKEKHFLLVETVDNLDQNSFWDPSSIDTLIFNSYVGSACILEYKKGRIEMLRATKHYIEMLGNKELSISDVLGLDWRDFLDESSFCKFREAVTQSKEANETIYGEYTFIGLPGCAKKTVIRGGVRVIAVSGDRWLVYCISENITAQREAEENAEKAIRHREQAAGQMKAILDNVDVGVVASIVNNGVTEFLFANEKFFEILGYTKEQFDAEIGDPYLTFAPEDMPRVKEIFIKHIEREEPGAIEANMIRRDGSRRLVKDAFSTCHFAGIDGPVQLSIFRDITDEHEAKLREKNSAEEINLIMKNVDCGICAINMNGIGKPYFIFANDQFYSVAGYTKEQIATEIKSFSDIVYPDDRERVSKIISDFMTSKKAISLNFRCIKRDGSIIHINSSVSFAEMTGYGTVAILVQTDITDAIQSQQRIQRLANQLEVIIDNTADAISAISVGNGNPQLVFANEKYYEQLGATKGDYAKLSECKNDFVIEEDRERVATVLFGIDSVGKQASIEFRIKRADGEIRWMRSNITVVNYPGIEGPVQLAVTSDITVQVEAALKEHRLLDEMQSMMDDMPGGFVRMKLMPDDNFTVTYCNDGFCKLIGSDYDSLMRKYSENPMADVHPNDIPIVIKAIEEIREGGVAQSSRYRLLTNNNDYIWVTVFGRITHDNHGNSFVNMYYNDETAQEKESRLRETFMDNLPFGAGIYEFKEGQMNLVYQNKSYWKLVGLYKADYPDPAPMSAIHPEDIPPVMQQLTAAIEHGQDVKCNIRLRHLTLGYQPVRLIARVVREETGAFLIIATFLPIEKVD